MKKKKVDKEKIKKAEKIISLIAPLGFFEFLDEDVTLYQKKNSKIKKEKKNG